MGRGREVQDDSGTRAMNLDTCYAEDQWHGLLLGLPGSRSWGQRDSRCWALIATRKALGINQQTKRPILRTRPGSPVPSWELSVISLIIYVRRVRTGSPVSLQISTAGLNFKEQEVLTCRNYFYMLLITMKLCGVLNERAGWKPSWAEFYKGTPTVSPKASSLSHFSLNKHCFPHLPLFQW